MTYTGDGAVGTAALSRVPDQAQIGFGTRSTTVADVELTDGRYSLYLLELNADSSAAPHFHRTFAESFQVLTGTVELYDGNDWVAGQPGDHLYIPPGGIHAYRTIGGRPASMLMLSIPGARREDYFAELAAIAREGRQLAPDEWTEMFARHDQYMV